MKTRRFVVLVAVTAVLCVAFLLPGCMRFDGEVDVQADVLTGKKPLAVQFTPLVRGCVDKYVGSFGDGTTSTERSPTHTYEQAGSYTVILAVTPCGGEPVSAQKVGYVTVTSGLGLAPTRMWCYYGDDERGRIWRSELVSPFEGQNSGTNEVLNHTIGVPHDFALLDTMLYWTDQSARKIYAADVTPGRPDNVLAAVACAAAPVGLAIDPSSHEVYWAEDDPGEDWSPPANYHILRARVDGSAQEEFLFWFAPVEDLAFDVIERDLYFTAFYASFEPQAVAQGIGDYIIGRLGADGGTMAIIVSQSGHITDIAIHQHGRKVYWVDSANDRIRRANLDGTDKETVVTDVPGIADLAIDEQDERIVWVSYVAGTAKLMSAALDGSDVRWRLMNTMTPQYTAIVVGPKPAWSPANAPGGEL